MINASDIIDDFQRFYREGRGYIPGTSGETWTQEKQNRLAEENEKVKKYGSKWIGKKVDDCSGAFVDAYRLHKEKIYQGSNRIAREYVIELLPISQALPGYAVFKLRKPGEQYYDLPDDYKPGKKHYNGDLNDYYHIGLMDEDGKHVINAQSTSAGFTRTDISIWHCAARLKAVNYENNEEMGDDSMDEPLYKAIVTADSGSTVNMRESPSKKGAVITAVKLGEKVDVIDLTVDGWSKIVYKGQTGYMMSKYLRMIGGVEDLPFDDSVVKISATDMDNTILAIENALALLKRAREG